MHKPLATVAVLVATSVMSPDAMAWDSFGHEVVVRIADHYLQPAVREKVQAILAADTDPLSSHDLIGAASWADKYRNSDESTPRVHYEQTYRWHLADIDASTRDIKAACFGRPALPAGTLASQGPAEACVIDKVDQFSKELKNPKVGAEEQLLALKFLIHLVGDLHQPLNVAIQEGNNHGMRQQIAAKTITQGTLYEYWNTAFVHALGYTSEAVAGKLLAKITDADRRAWQKGTPESWTLEAHQLGVDRAYGVLASLSLNGPPVLEDIYVDHALETVGSQLSKAGVRLAALLNKDLGGASAAAQKRN